MHQKIMCELHKLLLFPIPWDINFVSLYLNNVIKTLYVSSRQKHIAMYQLKEFSG